MQRLKVLIAFLFVLATGVSAWAGTGRDDTFHLEVVFLDKDENPQSRKQVSLDEVLELPASEFQTTTIWTEGVQSFRGVWLSDLIAYLEITEGNLDFSALNEYLIEIPLEDIVPGGPLVAYEWNGERMGPRNKGPLWVVFPYDSDAKFQTESIYAQSIWQLDRIEVYR
ncbi:MAG: molybdopterin-dependent oxidoreductase [Thalassovita sp.]